MRVFGSAWWVLCWAVIAGIGAWVLGLGDAAKTSLAAGHLLDWVMGGLCLLWLIVLLKAPWDLYFQAREVAFEIRRSRERRIPVAAGCEEYVDRLARRLAWIAAGAHLASAALVAGLAHWSGGKVGYYFAAFYLVSTVFRPAVAAYGYVLRKLHSIGQEARYPREDIGEMRERLDRLEIDQRLHAEHLGEARSGLDDERRVREEEMREVRQSIHSVGREFEATVSRLTDNQQVIQGIQAFVRLVANSAQQG